MKEIHIYILFILPVYSEFAHRFVPFLLYRIIKCRVNCICPVGESDCRNGIYKVVQI
jgi:hypothetical protein